MKKKQLLEYCQRLEQMVRELEIKQIMDKFDLSKRITLSDKKLRNRIFRLEEKVAEYKLEDMYAHIKGQDINLVLDREKKSKQRGIGEDIGLAGKVIHDFEELKKQETTKRKILSVLPSDALTDELRASCKKMMSSINSLKADKLEQELTEAIKEGKSSHTVGSVVYDLTGINTVDSCGDILMKGCFDKAIRGDSKIAIRVENEQEYKSICEMFKKKGWTSYLGFSYSDAQMYHMTGFKVYFTFKSEYHTIADEDLKDYTVIPFRVLKQILES